jgi:tetratricopeptide (TPR) repeat protein
MAKNNPGDFDPESAIIDAELLVKYRMLNRAIETLERAIDSAPRHVGLREKLREILMDAGRRDQAAQQCLALASLHISGGDLERANERLLEAKRLDPRVSVTGQLRDLRHFNPAHQERQVSTTRKILSGQLEEISMFDIIQILENSRLTGVMRLNAEAISGEIYLNNGLIVNARVEEETGLTALGKITGINTASFEFEKSSAEYERVIQANSNTALILDLLRAKDEEEAGMGALDFLS